MPSYTRGKLRNILTFVRVIDATATLAYGFSTKDLTEGTGVGEQDLTALGHLASSEVPSGIIGIYAANAPKPARYTKRLSENPGPDEKGSVSTFGAYTAGADALTLGWKLTKPARGVTLGSTKKSITVGAKITRGGIYLFPMNRSDFSTFGDKLGLVPQQSIEGVDLKAAFRGTSSPQPAKMAKKIGESKATFSSYASHTGITTALEDGFSLIRSEIDPILFTTV